MVVVTSDPTVVEVRKSYLYMKAVDIFHFVVIFFLSTLENEIWIFVCNDKIFKIIVILNGFLLCSLVCTKRFPFKPSRFTS